MNATERRTYSIDEVANQLGIGRGLAYQLANEGVFPSIRLGRRIIVPRDLFEQWLAGERE